MIKPWKNYFDCYLERNIFVDFDILLISAISVLLGGTATSCELKTDYRIWQKRLAICIISTVNGRHLMPSFERERKTHLAPNWRPIWHCIGGRLGTAFEADLYLFWPWLIDVGGCKKWYQTGGVLTGKVQLKNVWWFHPIPAISIYVFFFLF